MNESRIKALEELLKEPNPWIENFESLSNSITELTAEHQSQKLVDVERLFHSCRLETEVATESIRLLKEAWYASISEPVKLKVLALIDVSYHYLCIFSMLIACVKAAS